jgi:membrane protease YdiL (CAAX protease family)
LVLVFVDTDKNQLPGGVAVLLGIGLCVALGCVSGRYRILLVPLAILVIGILAGLIFGGSDDCRPSEGCEDDVAPWFWIVWTVFLVGFAELSIAAGVLLRRWAYRPPAGKSN